MSTEIILTFAVLGITIFLFVSEWLRVDVVALCVMLARWPGSAWSNRTRRWRGCPATRCFPSSIQEKLGPLVQKKRM